MDYSAKYRVSLSTLRRRIKAGEIEYKFIEGKYLIKNSPLLVGQAGPETIAPPTLVTSQNQPVPSVEARGPGVVVNATMPTPAPAVAAKEPAAPTSSVNEAYIQSTQTLLGEIKKAYALILQEKEAQIVHLKEEVADLKTLVRVLEDENLRIKSTQPSLVEFDLGLEA